MPDSAFKGWTRPGPRVPGGVALEAEESLDFLCGHFRIFQYQKGHRFSVDDILLGWFATSWCPRVDRAADLGSGIGSVAMTVAWRCPGAEVHTVEAQDISVRLARKSIRYNGLEDRVHIHEGDLRDGALAARGPFDLVTGSPPYWPVGSRVEAQHPQAIPARLEVRGTIADYALAAADLLAPGGVFACVFPLDQAERAEAAYRDAGLTLLNTQDVGFKEGEAYGLRFFAGTRARDLPEAVNAHPGLPVAGAPITIRRADNAVHESIARVRLALGFPPGLTLDEPVPPLRRFGSPAPEPRG
ncbi:MAG: methyltransferase [Holophagaceae bacterium]|nr:methyltransferase [Holophagaceae bacterium]